MIQIETPRGRFPALVWGDQRSPAALCLHGFPDHPPSFGPLAAELAGRGVRTIAPWMRGYAPAPLEGPVDIASLAADVIALTEATGAAAVVGHDWGAVATWAAAADLDVSAVCAIAAPHPLAFAANAWRSPAQLRRSRYMAALAARPDRLAASDFAMARALWRRWSPGYHLGDADFEALRATLAASHPHPARYYRALARPTWMRRRRAIGLPVLSIFGADDGCIDPSMCRGQERLVRARYDEHVIDGAGHFVHLERPARTAELIAADLESVTRCVHGDRQGAEHTGESVDRKG